MRDSYERFFSEGYITKDQFYQFGLKEIIYSPLDKAEAEWKSLKEKIRSNEEVFIRGFGRDAGSTQLFIDLYKIVFGNSNVRKDPTNNAEPAKIIKNLTGYSKIKSDNYLLIRNYQISHIFGRTKNIYAFTAPWNVVYIPKLHDPFTGHEAKGEMVKEFTHLFQRQAYDYFKGMIEDFNTIVTRPAFRTKMREGIEVLRAKNEYLPKDIEKLQKATEDEFLPIEVET